MIRYLALVGDHSIGTLFSGILVTTREQTPDERFEEHIRERIKETDDEEWVREYYSYFEVDPVIGKRVVVEVGEKSSLPAPCDTTNESYHGGFGEGALEIVKLFKIGVNENGPHYT